MKMALLKYLIFGVVKENITIFIDFQIQDTICTRGIILTNVKFLLSSIYLFYTDYVYLKQHLNIFSTSKRDIIYVTDHYFLNSKFSQVNPLLNEVPKSKSSS